MKKLIVTLSLLCTLSASAQEKIILEDGYLYLMNPGCTLDCFDTFLVDLVTFYVTEMDSTISSETFEVTRPNKNGIAIIFSKRCTTYVDTRKKQLAILFEQKDSTGFRRWSGGVLDSSSREWISGLDQDIIAWPSMKPGYMYAYVGETRFIIPNDNYLLADSDDGIYR